MTLLKHSYLQRFLNIRQRNVGFVPILILGLVFLISAPVTAAITSVTPMTWNIIGLDSNTPAFGPNRFPVGAKVCSDAGGTVPVTLTWDSANAYVDLRAGSNNPVNLTFPVGGGCADAYFEVEVNQTSLAYDTTRRYHITAGGVSTTTPRELYVERLVSQSRNAITNIEFGTSLVSLQSVAAGGSMDLVVGNTYYIRMHGYTATQGYEQLESFVNFPNTIFQVLSVETTYTADTSSYVSSPNDKLYGDGCYWENDPNSPNYKSCWSDGKVGGTIAVTYQVKIVSGGGGTEALNSLIHDFSGSSFHYNADYSTSARFANIIDPTLVTISKNFAPDPTNAGGVSALTFTLTNPNPGSVSGVNFTDVFPTSPATMIVSTPPNTTINGCGTPTFSPSGGDGSISFSNGTIAANSSCTVRVNVTPPATGLYTNTSNHLFIDTLDTGNFASDTLTVNNAPPPPSPVCGLTMASWTVPSGSPNPPVYTSKATDVATATASAFLPGSTQIATSGQGDTASWQTYGYKDAGQYIDFVVDTSKYSSVFMSFYVANPSPANGPTSLVVSYNNGAGWVNKTTITTIPLAFTLNTIDFTGLTSTTGNTTFRLTATNAKNNSSGASLDYDNITFNGCAIPNPPTITKGFSPSPVAVGATSTLTFTVNNPNASIPLTGIAFNDSLPAGLTVANGSSAQCGGTLTTTAPSTLSFTSGTLAANTSCAITAAVTATTAGPHNNVSGFVSSTESGTNTGATGVASASLMAVSPPIISKQFAPNPIIAGDTSTLTFIITNPNQNNALSGVAFTDVLPVGLNVADSTSSQCGGVNNLVTTSAARTIALTGGTIAAASTCTVTVDVTAPVTGTYNNTSGNVSHTLNGTWNGNIASDTLTVNAANPQISLLKQVGSSATGPWSSFLAVATGANVYYKFTIENAGDVALTSIGVSDPDVSTATCTWTDPLPVADAADNDHITTCVVGPVTAVAGSHLNTATASGTYSGTPYTDTSSATYATTGLTIAKSAAQTYFTAAGNVLNYSYLVTNSGYATLAGPVTVADDKSTDESCPALTTVGDNDNYLDPAEAITCTATYTVVAADVTAQQVTNVASATAGGVTSPTASKTIPFELPSLTIIKSVIAYSDPVNGTTNPKAIPGSEMVYTILATNTGLGLADSVVVADPIPANTELFVGDINGACSGPVKFTDGSPASGLSYTFGDGAPCDVNDLAVATDNISFSDDPAPGPYVYDYNPVPDANWYDANITSIKISLSNTFAASDGANNPSFELKFRVRVK